MPEKPFQEVGNKIGDAVKKTQNTLGSTQTSQIKAYWVRSDNVINMDADLIRKQGITDLFVLVGRFGGDNDYNTFLPKVLSKFGDNPRIHAWVKCFHDNKNFVDPSKEDFKNQLLDIIGKISTINGLYGVHLDYLRYSGISDIKMAAYQQNPHGKIIINNFISKVYDKVKSQNSNLKLSAAVMPEGAGNADAYGQDYQELAKYLDYLCPMIYKSNYNKDTAWISKTTAYINGKAPGKVIAGIQTYVDDQNPVKLQESELKADINSALGNGAKGFALFRYGLSNYTGG